MAISGEIYKTSSGVIGTSGQPERVYSVTWLSGTTAGYITLFNGTDTSGQSYFYLDGTASKSKSQSWEGGLRFSSGCYLLVDANVTSVVLEAKKEA